MKMRNHIISLTIILLLLLTGETGCDKNLIENNIPCECEEGKIQITELKNEMLYVHYSNVLNKYVFIKAKQKEPEDQIPIEPCGYDFADKYKKEGLPVIVSGDFFVCNDMRFFIQLTSIKK
ncbi:MAG: hypothetical protein J6X92_03755 [Bacteroidales bacterium]|nr:hypothetical protein [Bacteroidales bacterium]